MISILFVQEQSIYKFIRGGGLDCWDELRDAHNWPGGNAIVAHPPCREWSKLRAFSKAPPGEKQLAITAVGWVQEYGGVLEHPKGSALWPACGLPVGTAVDSYGGYSLCVDQAWWGHEARKATMLYIVGCPQSQLPGMPIRFDAIQKVVSTSTKKGGSLPEVSKKNRSATPVLFAEWLVTVAEQCQINKSVNQKQ